MITLLCLIFNQTGCSRSSENNPPLITEKDFDSIPLIMRVTPSIAETSGIADSRKNKGFIWAHEDSGNPTQLYLIGHDGKVSKTIKLDNVTNRDWEEMQLVAGNIYLADIGDNQKRYNQYTIYTFPEPSATAENVTDIQAIHFMYAEGPRDAEAFLVDPATKDIYIITKSDNPSKIYKLAYPYGATATAVGNLNYSGVVGAALSPDGKEIILKTYIDLRYYVRKDGQSFAEMFQNPFTRLPYQLEPLGEAVTFSITNNGYFTLSEKGLFGNVNLFFYKRK